MLHPFSEPRSKETSSKYREQEREESILKCLPEVVPSNRHQEDGRRRRAIGGEEGKGHQVPEIRKRGKRERSRRRKRMEDPRPRSPTPPPSSRGAPHRASEASVESHLEVIETPRGPTGQDLRSHNSTQGGGRGARSKSFLW